MNKLANKLFFLFISFSIFPIEIFASPDPNFHIYLMVGQSNMEGAAPIENQDRITNPRVEVLQDEDCPALGASYGQWRTASPPLIRCLSSLGLGPGDTFGKAMADNSSSEITIGLVGAAHGGQSIEYFLKNCADYNACYPTYGSTPNGLNGGYAWLLDLARIAQQRGVIKGIIFHQGESNTGDPAWPGRVNQLVTDIRNDLGIGNVPFIAGELPYPGCCASHNTLIQQLPSIISNAHVATAEGLNIHDQYHWDSAGVREMGRRYANIMLTLVDTNHDTGTDTNTDSDTDTDNDTSAGISTITVRMNGVTGDETVSLQVGGNTIQSWTVNTIMTDYTVDTDASGEIRVAFTNDNGNRDVRIDYIIVNGIVLQAEDQDDNTGAWGNHTCGGGTNSEWLHCNGSIGFGSIDFDDNSSSSSSDSSSSSSDNSVDQRLVYAINVGGSDMIVQGVNYVADRFASGGSLHSVTDSIDGTTDDGLYQTERYGNFTYQIPVSNASYDVSLHFAEIFWSASGQRSFNVTLEGQQMLSNVDLFDLAGQFVAYNSNIENILVTDGSLTVEVETIIDAGTLAGISIYSDSGEFIEP
jgi:hypothetical protein